MKIGHGKTRVILYTAAGFAAGGVLVVAHELFERIGIQEHNLLILVVMPLMGLGMALLAIRENSLFRWGSRLDDARKRVNNLMVHAATARRWSPVFDEEPLPTCWRELDCDKQDCVVYGTEHARCWLMAGTFCRGQVQGKFARKLKDCQLCEVYKRATADPVKEITENFYAMNYLLSEREEELEKAYEGSRQRSEKLAGLVGLSEIAMSSIHLSDLLKNLLESAASFTGADLGFVSLLDKAGEKLVVKATYGIDPGNDLDFTAIVGEGLIGQAFAGVYIAVSEDVATDVRVTSEAVKSLGARSMISIPLQTHEEPLGMMTLATLPAHFYSEEEKNTLCVVADRIAAAVENSRLAVELDRDREQAELIDELVGELDTRSDVTSVYDSFVKLADRLLDFDRASLAIWHDDAQEFEIVAMDTIAPRSWLRAGMRIPRGALPFDRVVAQGRFMIRNSIKGDEYPADKLLAEEGIRSEAMFPLVSKGEYLGTLNLGSTTENAFTHEDAEMLEPLTRQLGLMLDSARLLQEARSTSLMDRPSGLYNHRYFFEATRREVARSKRLRSPLTVLIIEIDGYQEFSEHHDDAANAAVVKHVASELHGSVREIDIVARYSGDEFAVLLPDMKLDRDVTIDEGALKLVGRLQDVVAAGLREASAGELSGKTHVGIAEYPQHADSATELLERTDWALREARGGSSEVVVAVRGRPSGS